MNRRLLFSLSVAALCSVAVVGCATQPRTTQTAPPDTATLIVGKPQIRLPGARLEEVRSIALGSAYSKGWTLISDSDDRIVLQRPMDPASPQAVALAAAGESKPIVEVTTYLLERPDGVLVALGAELLTTTSDQAALRVDYTALYQSDLKRSLDSLRATWADNRDRVAAAMASRRSPTQSPEVADQYADQRREASGALPRDPFQAVWAAETSFVREGSDETAAAPTTRPPAADPTPPPPTSRTGGVPVITPAPVVAQPTGPAAGSGMLTLNQSGTSAGLWAYYAEQYALTRGCTLTDEGARLIDRQPDYEIHQVSCQNRPTFILRCHNGICRSLG
ncbi:hypothetical protein ABC977_08670 [Thioalkalicoccus limnaeus]|uniref:Uncharacterized protein n=1 Tax=Thioalkalicoccus limnaeus TaxID=120681 RepID=A0ABV4BJ51_9GAMM